MNFNCGRKNLALTILAPKNCMNHCEFCNVWKEYETRKSDIEKIVCMTWWVLSKTRYPIKDVVITGGEPANDIGSLKRILNAIPGYYNVYINTTMPEETAGEMIALVNGTDKIKGVNISRHGESFEDDEKMMKGIAEDGALEGFNKKVRVNCVDKGKDVKKIIERWEQSRADIYFRRDFNIPMEPDELKLLDVDFHNAAQKKGYMWAGATSCNVCHTNLYKKGSKIVAYHKGMEKSSIMRENVLEYNDLIIDQAGEMYYDWEKPENRKKEIMCEMNERHEITEETNKRTLYEPNMTGMLVPRQTNFKLTCGGGGC